MATGNWKRPFICSKCGSFIGEEFPDSLFIGQGGFAHVLQETILICSMCNYETTWISENERLRIELANTEAELTQELEKEKEKHEKTKQMLNAALKK